MTRQTGVGELIKLYNITSRCTVTILCVNLCVIHQLLISYLLYCIHNTVVLDLPKYEKVSKFSQDPKHKGKLEKVLP